MHPIATRGGRFAATLGYDGKALRANVDNCDRIGHDLAAGRRVRALHARGVGHHVAGVRLLVFPRACRARILRLRPSERPPILSWKFGQAGGYNGRSSFWEEAVRRRPVRARFTLSGQGRRIGGAMLEFSRVVTQCPTFRGGSLGGRLHDGEVILGRRVQRLDAHLRGPPEELAVHRHLVKEIAGVAEPHLAGILLVVSGDR